MYELAAAKRFQLIGGNLALDFCNTMGGKRGQIARDHLHCFGDYIAWCHQAGLLEEIQAQKFISESESRPSGAGMLTRATTLREALFRIFEAVIEGKAPPPADLGVLNFELGQGLGRLCLGKAHGLNAFAWEWSRKNISIEHPLGPIAYEAAKLLTDEHERNHLRICSGDSCGWVFLDSSKNHSRRWCDMRDCGNRAKIRRHRMKQKRQNAPG